MVPSPLEGDRIRLRAHEPEDVDRAMLWLNDPEVRQFLGRQYPFSRKEATERLLVAPSFNAAFFAIVRKEDGLLIGDCGLFDASPENRGATLGIQIGDKTCWEGGYGTDTMRTLCRFGFDVMNLHRIDLHALASNERAIHVYEKIGFQREAVLRDAMFRFGRYHDIVVMGLLRGELVEGPR